jgi:hypothetical protein
MKNYFKPLFWMFLLTTFVETIQAQSPEKSQSFNLSTQNKIPYEDSLAKALQKFGMKLSDFSARDQQCSKVGDARFLKPIKGINPYPMSDSLLTIFERRSLLTDTLNKKGDKFINIIWIHGLNGNTNSLRPPAIATEIGVPHLGFKARKARSIIGIPSSVSHKVQLYSEDLGITATSVDLKNFCENAIDSPERTPRDYIIAHSQGGIVGREWLRNMDKDSLWFNNLAHGLVTFGTPHDGAKILNNCHPKLGNRAPLFMNEACKALGRAQITPMLNGNFITRILVSKNFEDKIISSTCNTISKTVIPLALDNYYKATTADYYVGAPFLKGYYVNNKYEEGLSEYTSKVPVVQFYGIEEQPIMWKFLSSTASIGHDDLDFNQRYFAYDKDDQVEKEVIKYIIELEAKILAEDQRIEYHKKRLKASTIPLVGPYIASDASSMLKAAQENKAAYLGAKNWLYIANDLYLYGLVGVSASQKVKHCSVTDYLQCRSHDYNPPTSTIPPVGVEVIIKNQSPTINGNCGYTSGNVSNLYRSFEFLDSRGIKRTGACEANRVVFETFKVIKQQTPNDGVVLASSAAHQIKVDNSQTHFIIEMPKTNHEQMKNSIETMKALNKLYDGKFSDTFLVDPR